MTQGIMLGVRRLAAYAIDIGVLFAVLGGTQILLSQTIGFPSWHGLGESAFALEAWVLLTISLPSWLYFILSDTSAGGATLGKRVIRVRVSSMDGSSLDTLHALLRTAVKLAPWELTHLALMLPNPIMNVEAPTAWQWTALMLADIAMLVYVGVLFATRGRRSVHDFAAGSRVAAVASNS